MKVPSLQGLMPDFLIAKPTHQTGIVGKLAQPFVKAGNTVDRFVHWQLASPTASGRSNIKLIRFVQDLIWGPEARQTKFQRCCTIGKRLAITTLALGVGAGVTYCAGMGVKAGADILKGRLDLPETCKNTSFETPEKLIEAGCGALLSTTAMTADMLTKAGDALISVARGTFLTASVPIYSLGYELPTWVYNTGAPDAIAWAKLNIATPVSDYYPGPTAETVKDYIDNFSNPLISMTAEAAKSVYQTISLGYFKSS